MSVLHPFENETQSIQIDELTIKNRLDRNHGFDQNDNELRKNHVCNSPL